MKKIYLCLALSLLVSFQSALSAEINCYSGKTRIYHGWGKDIVYADQWIAFTEYKSNEIIMVSADCIITAPSEYRGRYYAALKN